MKNLQAQNVVILGLGISGLAMARWCSRFECAVTVVDTRQSPPQLEQLKKELPKVRFVCTTFAEYVIEFDTVCMLLLSPGLKPDAIFDLTESARKNNIQIHTELSLFSMALSELYATQKYKPHVLAITGTNGKTTVTSLAGKLLEHTGLSVAVAGNIGPSLLDTLRVKLDDVNLPEAWVLELSSFQLNNDSSFEPSAGVVLNVTQDHLDWHGNMTAYIAAKSKVFGSDGLMILNRDDSEVMKVLLCAVQANKRRKYSTFGSDIPTILGDYGLESLNGMTWLVRATNATDIVVRNQRSLKHGANDISLQRLIPAEALLLRGQHNMLNALAALSLAESVGCSISKILFALREYKGEPHRAEPIGLFRNVEYVDDSKGTNVGATVAAISSFGQSKKVVVLLGGDGKGQDFTPLAKVIAHYARAVVLIGKDKEIIAKALNEVDVPKVLVSTMESAVLAAVDLAHAGDVVLLSPACASLDMFESYVQRGQAFRTEVHKIFKTLLNEVKESNSYVAGIVR